MTYLTRNQLGFTCAWWENLRCKCSPAAESECAQWVLERSWKSALQTEAVVAADVGVSFWKSDFLWLPCGLKHCHGTQEFWEESDTGANWLFFFFFSLLMKFEVHFIAPALPSRAARGMGRWGCGSLSLGLAVGPGGMLVGCSAGSFAGSVYALLYERIFNKFSSYRWLGREGLCLEVLDGTRRGCIAVLWLVCACVLCWWVCGAPSTRWIVPSVLTE